MASQVSYLIQDVPIEISLHISKMVNSSPSPLTLDSIIRGMQGIAKQTYVRRGLGMALQMGMIESTSDNTYKGTDNFILNTGKLSLEIASNIDLDDLELAKKQADMLFDHARKKIQSKQNSL